MTGNADWLSAPGAAEELGVTYASFRRWMLDGKIPAYRFGRVFRIKRADLDEFIQSCRVGPGDLDHLDNNNPHPEE